MSTTIKLPGLGESIESTEVVKILVKPGDKITREQVILELESGKAVLELPSTVDGVIEEIMVKKGDKLKVGDELMTVSEDSSAPEKPKQAAKEKAAPEKEASSKEKNVPRKENAPKEKEVEQKSQPSETPPAKSATAVPAAPLVRRLARQLGVELKDVHGSGPDGRVSVDDVTAFAKGGTPAGVSTGALPELPRFELWGKVEREKMSSVRYQTARQVTRCWAQIPMVTQFGEANTAKLEALCDKHADAATYLGGHLTMAVMIVKIAAEALKVFPQFNASVDMENKELIYKQYYNVGIAVSTQHGLYVPVLKNLDRKNMLQIAADVSAIAKKARSGKLTPDDMDGGCFTVTNLGSIAGTHFTPIVNYPEVAILGMGRAFNRVEFMKDKLSSQSILPLSLSYDHRMIDGADGASFIKWIIETIEDPSLLEP